MTSRRPYSSDELVIASYISFLAVFVLLPLIHLVLKGAS